MSVPLTMSRPRAAGAAVLLAALLSAPVGAVPIDIPGLGLTVARGANGVMVATVRPGSPAGNAGMRTGDLILSIDGVDVTAADEGEVEARLAVRRVDAARVLVRRAAGGQQELLVRRAKPKKPARAAPTLDRKNDAVLTGPQSSGRYSVVSKSVLRIGDPYIDFTLPRMGGGQMTIGDLVDGKPIFIDFWATWCAPCRAEAPALAEIYKRYGDRIHMVGVNLDKEPVEPLGWATEQGLTYPHLFTDGGWKDPVVRKYGVHKTGIPFNLLFDGRGRVAGMDLHGEPLAKALDALLADDRTADDRTTP